jgi:hypothetical protein
MRVNPIPKRPVRRLEHTPVAVPHAPERVEVVGGQNIDSLKVGAEPFVSMGALSPLAIGKAIRSKDGTTAFLRGADQLIEAEVRILSLVEDAPQRDKQGRLACGLDVVPKVEGVIQPCKDFARFIPAS